MSQSSKGNTAPKSMRHKQILDVAAENPDAPIAELAAEVPSATVDLVERVLEEHGDPAETDSEDEDNMTDSGEETDDGEPADSQSYPAPEELSAAERDTIRAIREYPAASQRDLAEKLGVTASTVSNRVNGIDGFDWGDREAFANAVFGGEEAVSTDTEPASAPRAPESDGASDADEDTSPTLSAGDVDDTITTFQSTVENLSAQLDDLEGQVETVADGGSSQQPFQDPELVHKVVHACMDSENITEEEELRILESLV